MASDLMINGNNSHFEGDRDSSLVAAMRRAVKDLHFGTRDEKEAALVEVKGIILNNGDSAAGKALAELGVVRKIVEMVDCRDERRRGLAAQVLAALADGSYSNKALMVEEGLLEKLQHLISTTTSLTTRADLLSLLLSLSSLSKTPFHISPSLPSLLPILTNTLNTMDTTKPMLTTLSILSNLSIDLHNAKAMVTSNMVPTLLRLSMERPFATKALKTLSNLAVTMMGRRAMEDDQIVPSCFMEAMGWSDMPKCQELASYVMMMLANGSGEMRRKVAEIGGIPVLLEVALLGTPLARKRAIKVMEWIKGEKSKGVVRAHSGPQDIGRCDANDGEIGKGKGHRKEIKNMVKQSLDRNMESIMRRASNGGWESPNCVGVGSLRTCSSTKSLPF